MKVFVLLCVVLAHAHGKLSSKEYLEKYGFFNSNAFAGGDLVTAIKKFQNTFNLPETGLVDEATQNQMDEPRCGMSDSNSRNAFADRGWAKKSLTYHFNNFSPDLAQSEIRTLTAKAFKFWSDVTELQFTETSASGSGDIVLSFGSQRHHDGRRTCYWDFDGSGGVLAHAFFPPDGRLHFDEDERYTTMTSAGTNYLWVATHEIGHILGLEHDTVNRNAVMFPYYRPYNPNGMKLHSNDVYRIQRLYGTGSGGNGGNGGNGDCKDERTGAWCISMKQRCQNYANSWTAYMKKHCYKTCNYC